MGQFSVSINDIPANLPSVSLKRTFFKSLRDQVAVLQLRKSVIREIRSPASTPSY